ncbi:MAG: aminotransferase class III-fold pyridoxal phosphate-dependent enzyme [Deltaproteobacteria bacterium]|nr:aminotransferase class III-fold pyridoxal phosphate-dependent enzyme [Deltaproteobacteria bacterium]
MNERGLRRLEADYCSWGDAVHSLEPPKIFAGCEGCFLYDSEGTPYLDLQMASATASFGYGNKRLNQTLKEQLNRLPQLGSHYLHAEKVDISARIAQLNEKIFRKKGRVHLNVGGSPAIEDAVKLVRNATRKNPGFAFMGGYHGRTLGATAITSSYRYRRRYGHFGDRAYFVPYPYCFRCFYGLKREDCGLYCLKQFERLFETEYYSVWDSRAGECEFGAFYMEPVQGTGGYVIPPKEYFVGLKKILEERKILLVDDEVQMGFFRTGKFWAIQHLDIVPDVIVFGKGLTNGLNPLSGVWAAEEIINPQIFPPGSTHSTYAANPQGTAIALDVLKLLEEQDYEKKVNEKGARFIAQLKELQKKYPRIIGDVDGLGMALRIEFCREDGSTPNPELTQCLVQEGLKGNLKNNGRNYGLVLNVGGYFKNVLSLSPSFEISHEEIDLAVELLDQLLVRCIK